MGRRELIPECRGGLIECAVFACVAFCLLLRRVFFFAFRLGVYRSCREEKSLLAGGFGDLRKIVGSLWKILEIRLMIHGS